MPYAAWILPLACSFVIATMTAAAKNLPPAYPRDSTAEIPIPFAFEVNGRRFRAGDYRVELYSCSPAVVLLRRLKHAATEVAWRPGNPWEMEPTILWRPVFRREDVKAGSRYILTGIRATDFGSTVLFPVSRRQRVRCALGHIPTVSLGMAVK